MNIKLTRADVDRLRTNGSFTTATLRGLALTKRDLTRGWAQRLIGSHISVELYQAGLDGVGVYSKDTLRRIKREGGNTCPTCGHVLVTP